MKYDNRNIFNVKDIIARSVQEKPGNITKIEMVSI